MTSVGASLSICRTPNWRWASASVAETVVLAESNSILGVSPVSSMATEAVDGRAETVGFVVRQHRDEQICVRNLRNEVVGRIDFDGEACRALGEVNGRHFRVCRIHRDELPGRIALDPPRGEIGGKDIALLANVEVDVHVDVVGAQDRTKEVQDRAAAGDLEFGRASLAHRGLARFDGNFNIVPEVICVDHTDHAAEPVAVGLVLHVAGQRALVVADRDVNEHPIIAAVVDAVVGRAQDDRILALARRDRAADFDERRVAWRHRRGEVPVENSGGVARHEAISDVRRSRLRQAESYGRRPPFEDCLRPEAHRKRRQRLGLNTAGDEAKQ